MIAKWCRYWITVNVILLQNLHNITNSVSNNIWVIVFGTCMMMANCPLGFWTLRRYCKTHPYRDWDLKVPPLHFYCCSDAFFRIIHFPNTTKNPCNSCASGLYSNQQPSESSTVSANWTTKVIAGCTVFSSLFVLVVMLMNWRVYWRNICYLHSVAWKCQKPLEISWQSTAVDLPNLIKNRVTRELWGLRGVRSHPFWYPRHNQLKLFIICQK